MGWFDAIKALFGQRPSDASSEETRRDVARMMAEFKKVTEENVRLREENRRLKEKSP